MSLMNAAPYHNEPGFESERGPGDAAVYNQIIHHETLRVAVVGELKHVSVCVAGVLCFCN